MKKNNNEKFNIKNFISNKKMNEDKEILISKEDILYLSEKLGDNFIQNKKDNKLYKYDNYIFRYYQFHRKLNQSKKIYSELNSNHNFRIKISIHNDKKNNKYELWIMRDRKRIKLSQDDDLEKLKKIMDKMIISKEDLIEKYSKEKEEKRKEKIS